MEKSKGELEAELLRISTMLFTLGELIKFQNREPSLDEERFHLGLAELLLDMGQKLETFFDNKT